MTSFITFLAFRHEFIRKNGTTDPLIFLSFQFLWYFRDENIDFEKNLQSSILRDFHSILFVRYEKKNMD